jgi:hypothetical protein
VAVVGRERTCSFGVADGNKRALAHWNCQLQFDPEVGHALPEDLLSTPRDRTRVLLHNSSDR